MNNIKAIVISDDHYNGLGMIRSLGILKLDVILILLTKEKSFIDLSRYIAKCIKITHSKDVLVNTLEKLVKEYQKSTVVLYPVNDFAAQIVDSMYAFFPSNVVCPNADGKMFQFADKYYAKRIAKECGITVPKGEIIYLNNKSAQLEYNYYPIIIKPLISVEGAKSHIKTVYNRQQLNDAIDNYREMGYSRALVEEYIDGNDSCMLEVVGARNSSGEVTYAGTIRKFREFPLINGSTSYASIVQSHFAIDYARLSDYLQKINFVGIFDFEFKFANGKAFFIECNYRNGAPGFVFTKNGFNLPGVWLEKEIGIDIGSSHTQINNVNFMIEQNDVINMLKGEPKLDVWIYQYKHACKVFSYKEDPKPVRQYYKQLILNTIKMKRKRKKRGK